MGGVSKKKKKSSKQEKFVITPHNFVFTEWLAVSLILLKIYFIFFLFYGLNLLHLYYSHQSPPPNSTVLFIHEDSTPVTCFKVGKKSEEKMS